MVGGRRRRLHLPRRRLRRGQREQPSWVTTTMMGPALRTDWIRLALRATNPSGGPDLTISPRSQSFGHAPLRRRDHVSKPAISDVGSSWGRQSSSARVQAHCVGSPRNDGPTRLRSRDGAIGPPSVGKVTGPLNERRLLRRRTRARGAAMAVMNTAAAVPTAMSSGRMARGQSATQPLSDRRSRLPEPMEGRQVVRTVVGGGRQRARIETAASRGRCGSSHAPHPSRVVLGAVPFRL